MNVRALAVLAAIAVAAPATATVQQIGKREIYEPQLEKGDIAVVPEYAGTLTEFLKGTPSGDIDQTVTALKQLGTQHHLVFGKPSAATYLEAAALLGLPPAQVAMVGDDADVDVAAAKRAGLGAGILVQSGKYRPGDEQRFSPAPDAVYPSFSAFVTAFLDGYLLTAAGAPFLPGDTPATLRAVAAFEVEKAAYEVVYEANNRPDWITIPLRGLARATSALARPPASGAA